MEDPPGCHAGRPGTLRDQELSSATPEGEWHAGFGWRRLKEGIGRYVCHVETDTTRYYTRVVL